MTAGVQMISTRTLTPWLATLALQVPAAETASGAEAVSACAGLANAIHVTVKNVRRDKGTITADLHGDDPEEFLKKRKRILRVRVAAKRGDVEMCLPAPHPGVYAIGLYHDVNGNRKFDKNFLGLPKEPYGVSNNPRPRLGPPRHKDAAFVVEANGTRLEITLRD
jgi:uncharacterized protein (DUF2141 family)